MSKAQRRRGRKVPPTQPGKRRQYAPGQLIESLDPVVCQNIEGLAMMGYERDGRGVLMVEISDDADSGIVSAQYFPIMQIAEMSRAVPFAQAQPINEAVKRYDPEREFVAMVMDVTPSLPGPQMWFDVFPRTQGDNAPYLAEMHAPYDREAGIGAPSSKKQRGRQVPPPSPSQVAAMSTAYALLEDLAREGFAKQGRGFVFYATYPDGTEPFVQYLTLDQPPGDGFVSSAPDLVEHVRTYDPQSAFVIFEGVINLNATQLEDVRIEVYSFLTGQIVASA
jgi:hypothetical protein